MQMIRRVKGKRGEQLGCREYGHVSTDLIFHLLQFPYSFNEGSPVLVAIKVESFFKYVEPECKIQAFLSLFIPVNFQIVPENSEPNYHPILGVYPDPFWISLNWK